MTTVTITSRPNRITIASKGVQGAPGPEGPQGIQGPKGDTGDVTPEAIAARDAAQEAASTASTAASTATGAASAASGSASDAADSANLAEQARLLGATIGFATKADMDASLAHPAGTLALVTSDAAPANNGTYRKTGASGSGAWVQSADRVSWLEQTTERIVTGSVKNLFDPSAVITGYWYNISGVQNNSAVRRVTPKIPLGGASQVAISGLDDAMALGVISAGYVHANFWNGDTHVAYAPYPNSNVNISEMVLDVPAGATSISLNLPPTTSDIPPRLQVELGPLATSFEPRRRPATALPEATFDDLHFEQSVKNIYDGRMFTHRSLNGSTYTVSGSEHHIGSSFVPVEVGKTYTISGLDPTLVGLGSVYLQVLGFRAPRILAASAVENFGPYGTEPFTFTVTDPDTHYIAFQISRNAGRMDEAFKLRVQVEEGSVATEFEPHRMVRGLKPDLERLNESFRSYVDSLVDPLVPRRLASMDAFVPNAPNVPGAEPTRAVGPYGADYGLSTTVAEDAKAAGLFAALTGIRPGPRSIYAYLNARNASGLTTLPRVSATPFSVPSGQLIHEPPTPSWPAIGWPDDYAHPSVAYDSAGVAGYKYWMVASILPGYGFEDEDVFVSNDAITWLRIKSLYEPAQDHHAPGLSLPPHALVPSGGRRYGFLPTPGAGDVVEISVPASAVGPELNNVDITLTGTPWKHDPAILIEGGYVYIYHTYHLSYATHPGGNNKFIVCTRTNDGVNWECVRSDGSTLPLTTAAASRQMFTKDGSGRYNYLWFPGNGSYSNPEIIKYGTGDFEFVYGVNFSQRYAGTSPWAFNFSAPLPFQDVGSGNHPGLMLSGGVLYLLNQNGLYQSSNRGQSFTLLPHYPSWRGGNSGMTYKKAMCVGEGGRVILFDVYSGNISAHRLPIGNEHMQTQRRNKMFSQEFSSVAQFVGYAANGIGDGYADVQIDQVNFAAATRKSDFYPYRGVVTTTSVVNNPHQRVKVADIEVSEGDTIYLYITLVARAGGTISFNGLEII